MYMFVYSDAARRLVTTIACCKDQFYMLLLTTPCMYLLHLFLQVSLYFVEVVIVKIFAAVPLGG